MEPTHTKPSWENQAENLTYRIPSLTGEQGESVPARSKSFRIFWGSREEKISPFKFIRIVREIGWINLSLAS